MNNAGSFGATFLVEVDGVTIGRFSEISGLEVEVSTEEISEGGQNGFVHKVPGAMRWPNLILKRGVTDDDNLFEWFKKSSGEGFTAGGNQVARSTAAITLMGRDGVRVRSWNVDAAFPIKWSGPTLAAGSNEMVVEELEIAHHGFVPETH